MRNFLLCSLVVTSLVACSGGKDGVDDDDRDGETDDTDDEDEEDAERPKVVDVTITECGPDVDGEDLWSVRVSVSDPQGEDQIASAESTVEVVNNDASLATYTLACFSDYCVGAWSEMDDGVDCAVGEDSVFRFVIRDKDGNESSTYSYEPD